MTHGRRPLAAILGALLLIPAAVPAAAGETTRTRWVDDDGRAGPTSCSGSRTAHESIQPAVDAAGPGDAVLVCPGSYVGPVTIDGNRDGLVLRGVQPWTADVVAPSSLLGGTDVLPALVYVDGVDGVRIQWLRLLAPTRGPCVSVGAMLWATDAQQLSIRSLRIRPTGNRTLGPCGFRDGIILREGSAGLIAFNQIQDFQSNGISAFLGPRVRIVHNSVRFFHAGIDSGSGGGTGIDVSRIGHPRLEGNVIRSLPTAGASTPELSQAIFVTGGDDRLEPNSYLRDTLIQYTNSGIRLSGVRRLHVLDTRIQGTGESNHAGIELRDMRGVIIRRARVSGFETGISVDVDSRNNRIEDNDLRGNQDLDCRDDSSGTGTGDTANTWSENLGDPALPAAICG